MSKMNSPTLYNNTPLCYNKQLSELLQIPDPNVWISRGLYMLFHVFSNGKLKSFDQLTLEFTLLNHMLFWYFQLHHALHTQFPGQYPVPSTLDVLDVISSDEPRKLISSFYHMLITPSASQLAHSLKPR